MTAMQFDPKKPFAKVMGHCALRPGVKFQQGGNFYDVHRRLLKSKDPQDAAKPKVSEIDAATEELREKVAREADSALIKMQKTQAALNAADNPKNRSAATKASNAYSAAQEKLELLSE